MQNETNNSNPYEIVDRALKNGELDKLLLGYPQYFYTNRYSYFSDYTDVIVLLNILYSKEDVDDCRQQLSHAIFNIVDLYEGIDPVATCLLYETSHLFDQRKSLGLPLEEITLRLRKTIKHFQDRLIADKTGGGWNKPNGRYEDMQRLSLNTQDYNGMPFCQ